MDVLMIYNKFFHHCNVHEIKRYPQVKTKFRSSVEMICCSVLIAKIIPFHTLIVFILNHWTWHCWFARSSFLTTQNLRNLVSITTLLPISVTAQLSIHLTQITFLHVSNLQSPLLSFFSGENVGMLFLFDQTVPMQ